MDKKLIVSVVAVVVVVVGTLTFFNPFSTNSPLVSQEAVVQQQESTTQEAQQESQQKTDTETTSETSNIESGRQSETEQTMSGHVVEMSSSGFSPVSLTIKKGETVTFVQKDSISRWPASAFHPTHTVYPGSDIKKCGSGEPIFDACKGLAEGESWSFTFNEAGSWKYHDHLNPSKSGEIIVK